MPDVAVYITSYNQRAYLRQAIESVLAQTNAPSQIVIVDDASSDQSQELIAEFVRRAPRLFKPLYHSRNLGVTRSRIDALAAVEADYVCYLDGDDRFLPEKLAQEVSYLAASPTADFAYSNYYLCDAALRRRRVWATGSRPPSGNILPQVFGREFGGGSLFRHELVSVDRWRAIGTYDPQLSIWEDFEMKIRLAARLRAVYCPAPTAEYRQHAAGLSRAASWDHLRALEYILQKNAPLLRNLPTATRRRATRGLQEVIAGVAARGLRAAMAQPSNPYLACRLAWRGLRYGNPFRRITGRLASLGRPAA